MAKKEQTPHTHHTLKPKEKDHTQNNTSSIISLNKVIFAVLLSVGIYSLSLLFMPLSFEFSIAHIANG